MARYLITERKGRWGRPEKIAIAFLEVTFPNGKKKVYTVKQTLYGQKESPGPNWHLTVTHMRGLIKPTTAKDWQIRMIMDGHGYPLSRKWGTPNLKGSRGASVEWDINHMKGRGGYSYYFNEKEKLIHAVATHLSTWHLRARFPMRILPNVPKSAVRKAKKHGGRKEIPRFGEMTSINLWMKTQTFRNNREKKLKEIVSIIQDRLKTETTASRILVLKRQLKRANKEVKKIKEVNTSGLQHMRIR